MNLDELKSRLSFILTHEEDHEVDWNLVEHLSLSLQDELRRDPPLGWPADLVEGFLSGFTCRRSDPVLAHAQRSRMVALLRS